MSKLFIIIYIYANNEKRPVRHKIAHSAVIRRVKPRKSEKAKRHKRKTQKRKSRNKVMRGGIHEVLIVYVIQNKLGQPKCFIIRQKSTPLDTIYLFFDSKVLNEELKTFLCAALNLDNIDSIQPQLKIDEPQSELTQDAADNLAVGSEIPITRPNTQEFKSLFVKLSGNFSYTLSSGYLDQIYDNCSKYKFHQDESCHRLSLSMFRLQNHTAPGKIGNGGTVIQRLEDKTKEGSTDYTFTNVRTLEGMTGYYHNDMPFDFGFSDLRELRNYVVIQTHRAVRYRTT